MEKENSAKIQQALSAFDEQRLVAIPTETVYGLAAPYNNKYLLKKIFELKKRPFFDPLIVHVSSISQAQKVFKVWNPVVQALSEAFWPGPLTIVAKKDPHVDDLITSGLDTVGLRWPDHSLTNNFIDKLGVPVVAPSANLFGKTSPTTSDHVTSSFSPKEVYVLDGGPCQVGIESTIVSVSENHEVKILRPGKITASDINLKLKNLDIICTRHTEKTVVAPGQIEDHYMPEIPLILCQSPQSENNLQLFLQSTFKSETIKSVNLDLPTKASLAARELYSKLRSLSSSGYDAIYFVKQDFHSAEEWIAIMDRLTKASSHII